MNQERSLSSELLQDTGKTVPAGHRCEQEGSAAEAPAPAPAAEAPAAVPAAEAPAPSPSSPSPEAEIAALRQQLAGHAAAIIELTDGHGSDIKTIKDLNQIIAALRDRQAVEQLRRTACTCADADFAAVKLLPHSKAAQRFLTTATKRIKSSRRKKKNTSEQLGNCVRTVIDDSLKSSVQHPDENLPPAMAEIINDIILEICNDLLAIKDPSAEDLLQYFANMPYHYKYYGLATISTAQPEKFQQLCRLLQVKKRYTRYLGSLIRAIEDTRGLSLINVWRERYGSSPASSAEAQQERASIARSADKANHYCDTVFNRLPPINADPLHPSIEAISDLEELDRIVTVTLPTTADNFHLLRSAVAKLHAMHLAENIRSQIDLVHMGAVAEHLRRRLQKYSKFIGPHKVPEQKGEMPMARKMWDKNLNNVGDIRDTVRFRVNLTEQESRPENFQKAIFEKLAVLISIFGTDIYKNRLYYVFGSNNHNRHSTGRHAAFHITFNYRYQCASNGKNKFGTTKIKTIPIECQIRQWMTEDEERTDHREYVLNKDQKITRSMGMDISFADFVEDLCDALLDKENFDDVNKYDGKRYERPLQEKMAMMLFQIITKGKLKRRQDNSNDELINSSLLKQICSDEKKLKKVRAVIKQYKDYQASFLTFTQSFLQQRLNAGKPKKSYQGWLGLAQKMLGESVGNAARPATVAESCINKMAQMAEEVLDSFTKRVDDTSIAPSSGDDYFTGPPDSLRVDFSEPPKGEL